MAIWRLSLAGFVAAFSLVAPALGSGALAADAAAEPADKSDMFDVAFGLAVTSNYLSRGITQTEDHPAVQAYVEFDVATFYAGLWASNVSFGGTPDVEADATIGWRPELGKFAFDLGYAQYQYLSDIAGTSYGEAYAGVDFSVTDNATIGGKVYYAPDYALSGTSATYVEANADLTLPHNLGVSGAIGYQQFDATAVGASYTTWNAGIYWTPTDATKIDLRYSDTNLSSTDCANLMTTGTECGAKVLVTFSVDTAISSLGGGGN